MAGTDGVGRHEGMAVLCEGALLGESVRALILKLHKSYAKARVIELLEASPSRVKPPCPYAEECGGCSYQHLAYPAQLEYKRARITEALERIGGVNSPPVEPVLGMSHPARYRNKGVFFSDGVRIGLRKPGSQEIIDIRDCMLQHENCALIIASMRGGPPTNRFMIRTCSDGESVVALSVNRLLPSHETLAENIFRLDCVKGVSLSVAKDGKRPFANPTAVRGDMLTHERLCGFCYRIPVPSFFQVNSSQAQALYEAAAEMAGDGESALDLYCGMGTLTMVLARRFGHVLGVEAQEDSVAEARGAARRNGVSNVRFIAGDAAKSLAGLNGPFDAIVLDPPRAGCSPDALEAIAALHPGRIVYVSCDPATLARDVKILCGRGYILERVVGIDMFCFTGHVECVALMSGC